MKCIACRYVDSPLFMDNNLNYLCLIPSFPFPHPTNKTKTKLQETLKKQKNKTKQDYNTPTNEPKTKLQKRRKKLQNKGKEVQHNMAMLKLDKTKHVDKNKEKNCKHPLRTSSLLQCVVLR